MVVDAGTTGDVGDLELDSSLLEEGCECVGLSYPFKRNQRKNISRQAQSSWV